MLPFSLKESRQVNPLHVLQRGLYGEKYLLTGHFYLSLNVSIFLFPSESLIRGPSPCSQTGSPWAVILCHQSHWSTFHSFIHSCIHLFVHSFVHLFVHSFIHSFMHSFVHSFIHSFIHSFMYVCQNPQKRSPPTYIWLKT
jgi:hypothetical protein